MRETVLIIVAFVLGASLLTFGAFGWDKYFAIRGWRRIPERTLLLLAAMGGSIGAKAGQRVFRHKTRKEPFRTEINVIVGIQILLLLVWMIPSVRSVFGIG